ncbi:MAG: phosphatase PAP2 family protein, partial [Solirubrobacterales bacterium]|nr:phosphatase PAP2 family protein [Solirubrobacterales bacterium]
APLMVAAASLRNRLRIPAVVALPVASLAPLAAIVATPPRSRVRYVAAGGAYMWLFSVSWQMPADDRARQRRRLRQDYPIRLDRILGAGVPPGLRLQRALRDPERVTGLDTAVSVIYGSWFVPHLLLGYVLLRHREFVPRAAGRLAAAYHLTVPFYWIVPTAPPWWASEYGGRMDGELQRVVPRVVRDVLNRPPSAPGESSGNPWGSMPSDHIASAAITAMALSEIGVLHGAFGWAYVAGASFAVVYLGEHYVVDVLAGLAIAEAINVAEPHVTPLVRRLARELE